MTMSSVAAFPRGKRKKAEADDHKQLGEAADSKKARDEDLFRSRAPIAADGSGKKGKKKKRKGAKGDDGDDFTPGLKVTSVEPLSYRALDAGMVVLGCVAAVSQYELRVSLPGHLVGVVPITNVSRPYSQALRKIADGAEEGAEEIRPLAEMFRPGMAVACAVESADSNDDGFFRVVLSLDPRAVQGALPAGAVRKGATVQAAVVSREDHGCVVDVGVAGVKAFLPSKRVNKYMARVFGEESGPPGVGQVLPVVVTKSEGGLATVTCEPMKLKTELADPAQIAVHSMIPGTGFKVQVKGAIKGGVRVAFGDFTAFVHRDHMDEEVEEEQFVEARVLYVTPTSNIIHMSLKPHLKFGQPPSLDHLDKVGPGHVSKSATVVHSSRQGLVVRLEDDVPLGFVSARQVTESGDIPDLKEKYPVGSTVHCRALSFDYADAMYVCSMHKSVLAQKTLLKAGAVKPGDRVSCKAKKFVKSGGLVVEVAKGQEAFIPAIHLSDVPLKNAEKKFPPGTKLSCRVLRVDSQKRRLHLTNKTILVKEEYPVVSNYSSGHVGVQTEGVVVKVTSEGLLMQLFGEVRGWVPKSRMSAEPIEYPEKFFFVGQVLKCQVVDTNAERERMTLSLILGGHHRPLGEKQRREGERVKLGSFYDCTVMDKTAEGLSVEVDVEGHVTKAFLPVGHLTDHPDMAKFLLQSYKEGDVVSDALCFERDVLPVMTIKPTLKAAARSSTLPRSFKDLSEGVCLPGVVCAVKPYGVFLRLPTWKFRKSALVPIRLLSDQHVDDVGDLVQMHQTVLAKVVEHNVEEQKVTMSMRPKDVQGEAEATDDVRLLESFLADEVRARGAYGPLSLFKPGDVVSAAVRQVTDLGVEAQVQGVRGIITNAGLEGLVGRRKEGEVLPAVVLYADAEFGCLELTANPNTVRLARKRRRHHQPKVGQSVKAVVVLVKTELHYAMLCARSGPNAGSFIHVPTRSHLNDQGSMDFVVGDHHTVVVESVGEGFAVGTVEKQKGRAREALKRTRKTSGGHQEETPEKKKRRVSEGEERKRTDSERSVDEDLEASATEVPASNTQEDPGWEEDFDPWSEKKDTDTKVSEGSITDKSKSAKTHLSKKEKKQLDKLEAEEIARAEQRVINGEEEAEPETAEEFDRLVLASPNSSLCWIKYMAFHAERKDLAKAREVVTRALERINVREQDERKNVYMAWLNLEISVGQDEEAADKVLAEALKYCDPYKVYSDAAAAFEQGGHKEQAEKLYKTLARRFCKEKEAWVKLGTFYFSAGDLKEARFTLQRAVQQLDRRDHVGVTAQFGLLEFRLGESERGKTVFETVLGNYPGRTDLWSVYADALVKAGEVGAARAVFERMVALRLQPKKMKFFFKKFLSFEESHGDAQGVERVRRKALEYVEGTVGLNGVAEETDEAR